MFKKEKNVFIAKVHDSFIFDQKSNKFHFYVVDRKKNSKNVDLYELTHLYVPDRKRISQLKSGLIGKIKLNNFDCASGIYLNPISADINGHPLMAKDVANNSKDGIHKVKIIK